ncbi:LANO_0E09758g1_1 [Lachancea nothofagi CBS 11611]|uniref:Pre-mRNA-splicing factor CWC21 n=1 Tax=Lachancea nothofagi CBS 11611 TaxID=1266666 RepID=A0A1G4JW74_9SACH|nr:LANO_0E09758g1_1 [Lachancea nothofagi CBS 11611]
MSFNGIGLKSAKGSSTSGHIQQSLALNKDRKNVKNFQNRIEKSKDHTKSKFKPIRKDKSILEHLSQREVELRVSEYRDKLEDNDELDDAAIDAKCHEYREKLAAEWKKEQEDEKVRGAYVSRRKRHKNDDKEKEAEKR